MNGINNQYTESDAPWFEPEWLAKHSDFPLSTARSQDPIAMGVAA